LPGLPDDAELHVLRSVSDLRRLGEAAEHARTAVVVGSGFIGCEAAASLAIRGLEVTVVSPEPGPQQQRLGDRVSLAIRGWLEGVGVCLHHDVEVASVEAPRRLHLSDGTTLEPDLVLLALGVAPATDFLAGSDVRLDGGRVLVDSGMQTSVPDVYAAGDAALADHAVAGRRVAVEHWGDAETMGEIAGRNAAGGSEQWRSVPGFWSEIGEQTLMYAAWGDGWDTVRVVEDGTAFTVWYGKEGRLVGVLAHEAEDDYERGQELIAAGAGLDEAAPSREGGVSTD
jgi:3-phenylpropionate/trans-cinnamate dioxygenase ferredoxin reductase subunit